MNFAISLFTVAAFLPLFFLVWFLSATTPSSPLARSFPLLRNKRICLLIAHPDDEAMFFAPTLLALTRPELGNHVKILCLSTGDADGLGHIRKKELQSSALRLGLRNESDVFVIDDPSRFPDSMTATWSDSSIASLLAFAFAPELVNPSSNRRKQTAATSTTPNSVDSETPPPSATIDALLTFDRFGVSNHPNHRSLYHGAHAFLQLLMKGKSGYVCPVTLYSLTTTNIFRKYLGVLDAPISMLRGLGTTFITKKGSGGYAPRLIFVSGFLEYVAAWKAMVRAHKSQMVWFRWGWITAGRYMIVNDLKRENVA